MRFVLRVVETREREIVIDSDSNNDGFIVVLI